MDNILRLCLDYKNNIGNTILHEVCKGNNVESVKLLINQGNININVQNNYKLTPLHYAYEKGNNEIIQLLIKAGADESVIDYNNRIPRDLLKCKGNKD